MEVAKQKLFAAFRVENKNFWLMYKKLIELRTKSYLKFLDPKPKNFEQKLSGARRNIREAARNT